MSNYYEEYKSLYDSFYGNAPTNHTKTNINKSLDEEIKKLYADLKEQQRLIELLKPNRKKESRGMSAAPKKKSKDEAIRELIKQAAMARSIKPPPSSSVSKPQIINEVVTIEDIEKFTSETHDIVVRFDNHDYYSEIVDTKVVGMETVEWWEYVLIYGIIKQARVAYDYARMSDVIKNGAKSSRTVSGKRIELYFHPKQKFTPNQTFDTVGGKTVIRETGTKYASRRVFVEIPLNKVEKKHEYREGYFIFEEQFTTLEPDFNKIFHEFENLVAVHKMDAELIKQAKKQIWNYGRLSGV